MIFEFLNRIKARRRGFNSAQNSIILPCGPTISGEAKEDLIRNGDCNMNDQHLKLVDDQSKANSAIQNASTPLVDEFRIILVSFSGPISISTNSLIDPSSSSTFSSSTSHGTTGYEDYKEYGALPKGAIDDLRSIAERMNSAGHLPECVEVYEAVRKSFLDVSFQRLRMEKFSTDDIRRLEWEVLAAKIVQWIRAAKICVRILFPREKQFCEQIFRGLGAATADTCFVKTVKNHAVQLFNFVKVMSMTRRSSEKLFKILDLHNTLCDLLPEIADVFQSKALISIKIQAAEIRLQLVTAARGMLSEFENAVLHELSNYVDPGGRIHPLTVYVGGYIYQIACYEETLTKLIISVPTNAMANSANLTIPDIEFPALEGRTPLAIHLIWIIVFLLSNLEGKSKHCEDASLAHFFMMNNVNFIVQRIHEVPELWRMVGEDYLEKFKNKFEHEATSYHRSTWDRVLHCLRDEGLHVNGIFSSGVSKSALKERLKTFNAMFEEVQRTQATWLVPDRELREKLRLSISEKLIPAYRSFLEQFKSHIESGKHPETYIKYSDQELKTAVLDFFPDTR